MQMPVVPAKAMNLLERNLTEPEEVVRISFRPNEVLMKTERAMIYSRLVEGRFPSYKQVIPSKCIHRVPLAAASFLAAVRQSAIMTDETVRFHFAKQKLTLRAQGADFFAVPAIPKSSSTPTIVSLARLAGGN